MDNNQSFNDKNEMGEQTAPENTAPENTAPETSEPAPAHEAEPQPQAQQQSQPRTAQAGPYMQNNPYTQNQNYNGYNPYGGTYAQHPPHIYGTYQAPRGTVYINQPKTKAPKAKLGAGAAIALVLVCALVSGTAAMGGTFLVNKLFGNNVSVLPGESVSNGEPSVIFKTYENENREAGTYSQVADTVKPTVVEITTESIVTDGYFWGGGYVTSGAGSGVIISADGYIVTNNHVISGANTVTVTTAEGEKYSAEIIGSDADSDIAIIKIEASELPFALLGDSEALAVGQEVVAVGNPLGELGGTVTNGIVSALSRDIYIDGVTMTLIQTNAAVNPGNSGGGLFNLYGELVGIVNAKSTNTASGTAVEGIGFAIPVDTVSKVVDELVNYGYVRGKAALGITYIDIDTSAKAWQYGVSSLGLYVSASYYTNELQPGDRIVGFNGVEITYSPDLKAELRKCAVGDEVTISIVRNGRYKDVKVTLREYTPDMTSEPSTDESVFEDNFGGR